MSEPVPHVLVSRRRVEVAQRDVDPQRGLQRVEMRPEQRGGHGDGHGDDAIHEKEGGPAKWGLKVPQNNHKLRMEPRIHNRSIDGLRGN